MLLACDRSIRSTIKHRNLCEVISHNEDEGLDFRATKDIDLVLIVEAVDAVFGRRLWDYIVAAGYEHKNKSTGAVQFYRFTNPQTKDYPAMIELFARISGNIRMIFSVCQSFSVGIRNRWIPCRTPFVMI